MSLGSTAPVDSPLWSIRQTAEFLGLPISTLHHLVSVGGAPPSFKIGKARKFDKMEVIAWLEERKRTSREH